MLCEKAKQRSEGTLLMTQWLLEQLQSSARGFIGAVEQLPTDHLFLPPPRPDWLGEWCATRCAIVIDASKIIVNQDMQ